MNFHPSMGKEYPALALKCGFWNEAKTINARRFYPEKKLTLFEVPDRNPEALIGLSPVWQYEKNLAF